MTLQNKWSGEFYLAIIGELFIAVDKGLPRNPRKVKRLLQTFLLLWSFASDGVKNGSMQSSLIAKVVIVQSQFRSVYEDLARFNTLLAELEKLYNYQAGPSDSDSPLNGIADPILQEKVKATASQFPSLRKVLLKKGNDGGTFVGVDIEQYLSLTESTVETKPIGEVPTQDTSAALGQYLQNVISATQAISLRTIDPSVVPSEKLDVARVLNIPKFTAQGEDGKHLETSDVLKRTARAAILGGVGSGKSSLLLYLANTFARSLTQGDTSLVSQLGVSENLLPILIQLRKYGLYLQETDSNSATPIGFLEFLDKRFKLENISLPPGFFTSYLERGTCILLLDGLDEVTSSERPAIVQAIIGLGRRYPTARIIVTSRPAAYFPGLGEDFAHYTLAGFDDSRIEEFVKKWSLLLTEDSTKAEAQSASILAAISSSVDLRALARNPLLLTTIIILHTYQGVLPKRRADLYEDSLDVLLSRWDAAKGIKTTDLRVSEIKSLLGMLAFSAQDAALNSLEESFVLSVFSDGLRRKGLSKLEAQNQSISLLETVKERAGILIEIAPNIYQFVHLAFQEYLASFALSNSSKEL